MARNVKGSGSFKENPDGSITLRKSVGRKADGHRKILTVTAETKAACIRKMKTKEAEWEKEKDRQILNEGSTVVDLCRMHLRYQTDQDELKPKSVDRREVTIEKHIEPYSIGHIQVQALTVEDVDSFISQLIQEGRLSSSSIQKALDVLNSAFQWAVLRGDLDFNPVAPIKPTLMKRIQKLQTKNADDADVVVLSPEEIDLFEKEASRKDKDTGKYVYPSGLYGLLLLFTGMRVGEMLALRWSDVDFEHGFLTIDKSRSVAKNRGKGEKKFVIVEGSTKNNKSRRIKLLPEALEILKELRKKSDQSADGLIVTTSTGKENTATNLEHGIKTIFKNAGVEMSGGLHIFRRSFATRMYEKGIGVKIIAAYIGDLESTTERYYIAARRKVNADGRVEQVVFLPEEDIGF